MEGRYRDDGPAAVDVEPIGVDVGVGVDFRIIGFRRGALRGDVV
jgi:hypothetical protein